MRHSSGPNLFFYLVAETLPTKNISWNYNERHHSKGPMDGLGGTLKRKVFNAVKSGKVVVDDPEEFAMAAVNIVSGVHTIYLKESDLLMEPEEIKDAPSIKGTLNVHRFDRHTNKKGVRYLKYYHLSDDDHELFTQWYTYQYPKSVVATRFVINISRTQPSKHALKWPKRNRNYLPGLAVFQVSFDKLVTGT